MNVPGLHIKDFNERIKIMNQVGKKDIIMTAQDARNLHADIFSLLNTISELTSQLQQKPKDEDIEVEFDGGAF